MSGKARVKLVAFDMDGVLVECRSSWRYLHMHFGSLSEVEESRDAYLYETGELSYEDWMIRDIQAMLKARGGTIYRWEIEEAFRRVKIRDGIPQLVKYLMDSGVVIAIISGGIDILARRVARELGIPESNVFANGLVFDGEGRLLPRGTKVVEPLKKDEILRKLSLEFGVNLSEVMYVGDSPWDVSAFRIAGYPVLFLVDPNDEVEGVGKVIIVRSVNELFELIRKLT